MPNQRTTTLLASALLLLTSTTAFAQQPTPGIDRELPALVEIYKTLHQHPELSHHETWTAAYLAAALRKQGFTVTEHLGKYRDGTSAEGLIAILENGPGPRLLIRTELDALPVEEKTNLPYASHVTTKDDSGQPVSIMHACGHDIHITTILGTVQQLVADKSKWHGTLMIVGQPAEEVVDDGARAMLADHVYERFGRPDFVIAEHDVSDIAAGQVGVVSGPFKSSATDIDVVMRGVGGHGAKPEQTKDPVVMAGEFLVLLQTIVSRQTAPLQPAVLTVGHISGGTKRNIIPEEVRMEISMRSFDETQRLAMIEAVKRTANGVAIADGVPENRMPLVTIPGYVPVTINDAALADRFRTVARTALGPQNLVETKPSMASEDFGAWALPDHSVPIFCFWLGVSDPAKVKESERTGIPLPATHSSQFAPVPEPTIRTGVIAMTALAISLLNK
ncbi:amidohydrolase [Granulicella arctica]|uniref:amidohydrolase n=1 Tax=Granulicella arctica TaxID=940613 RepID=UPI0021E006C0|nr:amidohydrolase [Granulicella arctica]